MRYTIHAGRALTPAGWQKDCLVTVLDGVIQSVTQATTGDFYAEQLVPGMVDLHNHGGQGFDASRPTAEGFAAWTLALAKHGVTDVLVTLGTGDVRTTRVAIEAAQEAMRCQQTGELAGARIVGVHLEGPFISDERPGAMNRAYIQPPSIAAYDEIAQGRSKIVKLLSLAPEVPGAMALTSELRRRGVRVQAGHTDASFEEGMAAFAGGVGSVCHFFNAARSIHHREPGLVTAALLSKDVYCELICDFVHIHPGALQLVIQAKGPRRVCLISDAVMSTGLPDGEYFSSNHAVIVKDGISRTPEGALSGGGSYVSDGARNLIDCCIPAEDAFTMASRTPAEWMGFAALGAISPGKAAHLTALDAKNSVTQTFIGPDIYESEGTKA